MDFKNSLMTGAGDQGFQSTRQQRCNAPTFHESINAAPAIESRPEVVIDHSVENYRLLIGNELEYVGQVLDYSRTHSLSRRGVSKLVVDPKNYILLQHHPAGQPESSSLFNQLLEAGVEIIPLDDVLQHIKKKYSATMEFFELFKKVPLKRQSGSVEENDIYSGLFSHVISLMIPDYAFIHGIDGKLKTVTVTKLNFLSSLYLPASAGREEDSLVELVIGVLGVRDERILGSIVFLDGNALANLISNVDNPSRGDGYVARDLGRVEENIVTLYSNFETSLYSWVNSAASAKKRADIVNDIFLHLRSKPLFFVPSVTFRMDGSAEFVSDEIELLTLEELVNDSKHELLMVCCLSGFKLFNEESSSFRCSSDYENLIVWLSLSFFKKMNLQYLLPELKARAEKYNVEWNGLIGDVVYYSSNYMKSFSQNNGSDYMLQLSQPEITFFSQQRESLQDFIQSFVLNAQDTIKAKYALPPLGTHTYQFSHNFIAELKFPLCSPFMNVSHMDRLMEGGLAELNNIYEEVIYSYPPGAKYCRPRREASLLNDFFGSAMLIGLLSGALDGSASHFGRAHLVRNPVVRGIQGYLTGGLPGVGMSAVGWGLCWLPGRLRKGAHPGSWWRGCAMIVESLGMALPFLSGNVYRSAGGVLGFMLGKFGAETTLVRLRPHEERSKQYRRRRNRNLPPRERCSKRPSEAKSEKTVSHEDSLARLISENSGNSVRKISNVTAQEMANHLEKLKHSIKDLPDSMLEELAEILPWSTPMIGDVIAADLDNIEDSQARAGYIRERLDQCEHYMSEQSPGGLAMAVKQFPGLYLLYLKSHPWSGIDITCVDRVWAELNRDSPSDLLMQTGKRLIEALLCKTDSGAARKVLDDDKLTNKNRLEIFNGLSSQKVLLQNGVPENLGRAYLEQIKLDPGKRKQDKKQHIIEAINIWLKKYSQKPLLTDKLIHLLIDFKRLAGDEDAETLLRFRTSLHEQAKIERSQVNNVQRCLRAEAIMIELK